MTGGRVDVDDGGMTLRLAIIAFALAALLAVDLLPLFMDAQ